MQKVLNVNEIRDALAKHGMTQGELAKAVGTSSQAVTNWLKGRDFPRPATLLKLASTLQLGFDQLVEVDNSNQPVVAFRKKGSAKTTQEHISKAREVGELLKLVVPYLPPQRVLRTQITSPSCEYRKLQLAVSQTRERLGIGEHAVLDYQQLIGEFKKCGAILVPVLWGAKGKHENALHIHIPNEDVTFIFLNLDTRLEDFKFWMTHELAHVYTPELAGKDEGEDFADAFAGAILFPEACAAIAYKQCIKQRTNGAAINVLLQHADQHEISLNTVFQQVNCYVHHNDLPALPISENSIHAVRNSNPGPLISNALFDPVPPSPARYIADAENLFRSDFFGALKEMLLERETGPGYLQQVLDISIPDAKALHKELTH